MRDMLVRSVEHQAQQTSGMYMLSQAIHHIAKIAETKSLNKSLKPLFLYNRLYIYTRMESLHTRTHTHTTQVECMGWGTRLEGPYSVVPQHIGLSYLKNL